MFKPIHEIIVDIETVGIFCPQKTRGENGMLLSNAIFNVGITVQNSKGVVLESYEIGIKDIWEFPEHRIMDFYRKNFTEKDFEIMFDDFEHFFKVWFIPFLKKRNGKAFIRLWSFNAEFDRRGFVDNLKIYNTHLPERIYDNWSCIMVLFGNVLNNNPKQKKKYLNFLIENEFKSKDFKFVTEAGNFKTSAEATYRWLNNQPDFIEEHKGKADTLIEGQILQWCKKFKWSHLDRKPQGGGWAITNDTARAFQSLSSIVADYRDALDSGGEYPHYLDLKNTEAFDYLLERAFEHNEKKDRKDWRR
jgi:hypothetical protein